MSVENVQRSQVESEPASVAHWRSMPAGTTPRSTAFDHSSTSSGE